MSKVYIHLLFMIYCLLLVGCNEGWLSAMILMEATRTHTPLTTYFTYSTWLILHGFHFLLGCFASLLFAPVTWTRATIHFSLSWSLFKKDKIFDLEARVGEFVYPVSELEKPWQERCGMLPNQTPTYAFSSRRAQSYPQFLPTVWKWLCRDLTFNRSK